MAAVVLLISLSLFCIVTFADDISFFSSRRVSLYSCVFDTALRHNNAESSYIFLHAAVGIFKKKRIKNPAASRYWGYGREIMESMLSSISNADLGKSVDRVFVTLLGNDQDRALAIKTIQSFNSTSPDLVTTRDSRLQGKLFVAMESSDLYVAEFPTMTAIKSFAGKAHRLSKILYIHTKGMRNAGTYSKDWREYMMYYLVERAEICMTAISPPSSSSSRSQPSYDTCSVQRNAEEYEGNMFWATAEWIKHRQVDLKEYDWNMNTRFAVEDFLLSVSKENERTDKGIKALSPKVLKERTLCLLYINHNLYDCPTPRSLYANASINLPTGDKQHRDYCSKSNRRQDSCIKRALE